MIIYLLLQIATAKLWGERLVMTNHIVEGENLRVRYVLNNTFDQYD